MQTTCVSPSSSDTGERGPGPTPPRPPAPSDVGRPHRVRVFDVRRTLARRAPLRRMRAVYAGPRTCQLVATQVRPAWRDPVAGADGRSGPGAPGGELDPGADPGRLQPTRGWGT